jgi:hypothetical protein
MTAIEWAVARGDQSAAELLLPYLNGTKGNRPVTHWAEKALYAAMRFRRKEMVDWIIERGQPDFFRMLEIDSPSFGWLEQSLGLENTKKLINHFVSSSARPVELISTGSALDFQRGDSEPLSLASRYALSLPVVAKICPIIIQMDTPICKDLRILLSMMNRPEDIEYYLATIKVEENIISENILRSVEHKRVERLGVFLNRGFNRQQVATRLRNTWNLPRNFVNSYHVAYVEDYKWHTYKRDPEKEKRLAIEQEKANQQRDQRIRAEVRGKERQIHELLKRAGFSDEELPISSTS